MWQPLADATADAAELQDIRSAYEAMFSQFSPPPEVEVRPVNAGGVPAFVLTPHSEQPVTVLYLHGGGHALGSAFGYRSLAGALAAAAETGALIPEYRLAPEHPFPASLEDAVPAYEWIIRSGTKPRDITVAGDSSGSTSGSSCSRSPRTSSSSSGRSSRRPRTRCSRRAVS